MNSIRIQSLALGAILFGAMSAQAADYKVDPVHSKVGFSVKHMVISTVSGSFKDFEGEFSFDPKKGTLGNNKFVVQAKSIDTDNEKRDEHLRSPDFFDVEKYPTLTVTNSKIEKAGKDKYKWKGDLTLHGVTKPVTFDLTYNGTVVDAMGKNRAGFNAVSKINRKDFGLNWNKNPDKGGVAVSDEVTINLDIAAVETAAEAAKTADSKK